MRDNDLDHFDNDSISYLTKQSLISVADIGSCSSISKVHTRNASKHDLNVSEFMQLQHHSAQNIDQG